jgi:hypothetical protein
MIMHGFEEDGGSMSEDNTDIRRQRLSNTNNISVNVVTDLAEILSVFLLNNIIRHEI